MKNFKQLLVWQKGMKLAEKVYGFVAFLPAEEKYGLRAQLVRAAVSIPSNVAEGSARSSEKDYIRFLEMSLGSAYELETQLLIARSLDARQSELIDELLALIDEEQKMLQSFMKKIRSG